MAWTNSSQDEERAEQDGMLGNGYGEGCFEPPMGGISTLMSMVRTTLSEKELLMRFRKGVEGA